MIPFDLAELKKVNNMSTEQGNKLIAEFMKNIAINSPHLKKASDLEYHSSWDWLKPVIDKIFMYAIAYPDEVLPIREMKIVVDILPAWERVVKFCEWYNKQKSL